MFKSATKFLLNLILLVALWLGWPSSVFHSDAIDGHQSDVHSDHFESGFSPYIYDEKGNQLLELYTAEEVDSLIYGIR